MFKDKTIIDVSPDDKSEENTYSQKSENHEKEGPETEQQSEDDRKDLGINQLIVFGGLLVKKIAPMVIKRNPKVANALGVVAEGISQAVVKDRIGNRAISNAVIEDSISTLDGMLEDLKSQNK